jgi:hypothetical protein
MAGTLWMEASRSDRSRAGDTLQAKVVIENPLMTDEN